MRNILTPLAGNIEWMSLTIWNVFLNMVIWYYMLSFVWQGVWSRREARLSSILGDRQIPRRPKGCQPLEVESGEKTSFSYKMLLMQYDKYSLLLCMHFFAFYLLFLPDVRNSKKVWNLNTELFPCWILWGFFASWQRLERDKETGSLMGSDLNISVYYLSCLWPFLLTGWKDSPEL